ncbi:MAG: PhoU domain-containing protein [Candidatus Hodarchaeales archaeon]|jgi:phosphate uptake regulator
MNSRKVHDVKGSFIVYLPKSWAVKYGINKSKEVDLEELVDGSLILSPSSNKQSTDKVGSSFVIDLNRQELPIKWEYITNLIIGAYVVGVDQITIQKKQGLSTSQREEVSNLLRNLFGFEIDEETSNKIRINSIGETTESTRVLLLRTFSILKLMFDATKDVINTQNEGEINAIIRRDDDIDRFRLLIERQTHRFLINPTLALKIGLGLIDSLHISQIVKFAERLGDHIVLLAEKIRDLPKGFPKEVLIEGFNNTEKIFGSTLELVTSKDLEKGYSVLDGRNSLLDQWKTDNYLSKEATAVSNLFIHLERILDYCSDIIEIIIDSDVYSEIEYAE